MRYGESGHCHPVDESVNFTPGSTIEVPAYQAEPECCAELRKALIEANKAIVRLEKRAESLEKFKALLESMPAGAIVSNGATPAKLTGVAMSDLARALQPFLSRDQFFDPFGNEIPSKPGNQ